MQDKNELLKLLPKVDVVLSDKRIEALEDIPRTLVLEGIRSIIELARNNILNNKIVSINYNDIINEIVTYIAYKKNMHLKPVVNGTGTVLHTNLGRAVLAKSAVEAVVKVSSAYSNLEFNIETANRGTRYSNVEELICKITGAEAALVVNNNAAAVLLALNTLSKNKDAIVSRGQLVEIGGSFRIPAVMELSGAKLIEVGTTNRTHLYDYKSAINENTGVILKVHQSNFKIMGFTKEVNLGELVELGNAHNIPILEDLGSGVLLDISRFGFSYEPMVQESIKKGVHVVTFSGDKLLGGPQAGIIAGKNCFITAMKENQLLRALRIDKMSLAALEATLRLYLDEATAISEIPVLNMLIKDIGEIRSSAQKLSRMLKNKLGEKLEVKINPDFSQIGGGAMPLEKLDTYVLEISSPLKKVEELEYLLRKNTIPIITRIYKDRILIDVRTLLTGDYNIITDALDRIL